MARDRSSEYLDARASRSERGDYYLGRDGLPAEAPGQWHAPAKALRALGIDPEAPVGREALGHLQETVPTIKAYQGRGLPAEEVTAAGLLTAEFLHTTARGVDGGTPDPQLHSHCVITGAIRADGSIAAVRSRPERRVAQASAPRPIRSLNAAAIAAGLCLPSGRYHQ